MISICIEAKKLQYLSKTMAKSSSNKQTNKLGEENLMQLKEIVDGGYSIHSAFLRRADQNFVQLFEFKPVG